MLKRKAKITMDWDKITSSMNNYNLMIHTVSKKDAELYFFYDESNNMRLFRNKETGFNKTYEENFVLGGIVSCEPIKKLSLENFIRLLNLNKNMTEIKFKHISNKENDFYKKINNEKLTKFLDYLLHANLIIHFQVLNPFYFGIVDLIDELHDTPDYNFNWVLKNELFNICIEQYNECSELFLNYKYPCIKRIDAKEFLEKFTSLLKKGNNKKISIERWLLRNYLIGLFDKLKNSSDKLIFHDESEKENILVKNFSEIYRRFIYIYYNSEHIFDEETTIKKIWENEEFDKSSLGTRYCFEKSHNDLRIQISDCITGFIRALFDYLTVNDINQIMEDFESLDKNSTPYCNLIKLQLLLERTQHFDSYLLNYTIPLENIQKFRFFYSYFSKNN